MTLAEFKASLSQSSPPDVSVFLQAMWVDARGDWDKAHELVQDISGNDAAWVHAYLHRKEGDHSNAQYWYSRANRPMARATLEQEWEDIVSDFLKR